MVMFKEGDNPQPRTPAATVYANTIGYDLGNGNTSPCTLQGQRGEYVYNDSVAPSDSVANGFAVGVMSHKHSGGIGVPVLAGGPIVPGHDLVVGIVEFAVPNRLIDGGSGTTNVNLPVVIDIDDADDGDWIIGRASLGTSATAKDDFGDPTIAMETYDVPRQVKGAEQAAAANVLTFHIDLATIAGDGNVIDDFVPGFAGEFFGTPQFVVTEAATTAGKAVTLNIDIDGTNVTGGVVALTSANVTPAGSVVDGTPITVGGAFAADSAISIEATGATAFAEGEGDLIIPYRATV
jgi:hypothetical protein